MRGSFLFLVSLLLQVGTMSHKYYSIAFKLRAVAVEEAQRYLFPGVTSGLLSYKWRCRVIDGLEETPVQNLQVRNRYRVLSGADLGFSEGGEANFL